MLQTLLALAATLAASQTQPATPPPAPTAAPAPAASTPAPAPQPIALPTTWHGTWRGDSSAITTANRPAMNFTMQLRVGPVEGKPDRLTWEITYEGAAGNQVRPYELIATPNEPNRFVIDEKNGILIDAGLVGYTIATHFTVQNVMITANYRLEANTAAHPPSQDRIIVELTTFKADDARTSGGGGAGAGGAGGAGGGGGGGAEGIPEVKSWKVAAIQRAELLRQK